MFASTSGAKGRAPWILWLILIGSPIYAGETDETKIEKTYNAWVAVANEKNLQEWALFLAPDAYFLPPDSTPLTTEDAILDYYQKAFVDPEFSLDCEQLEVHVAQSGEMAWSHGICIATFTDADGDKASGTSRWFKVWVKRSDGTWLGRVNTWKYVD